MRAAPAAAVDPATGTLHVAWYEAGGAYVHATCTPGSCTVRGAIGPAAFSAAPHELDSELRVDGKLLRAAWADGSAAAPLQPTANR